MDKYINQQETIKLWLFAIFYTMWSISLENAIKFKIEGKTDPEKGEKHE